MNSKVSNPRSGNILTVLFVIVSILLVTLTAASLFFHQKEIERRKDVEEELTQATYDKQKLESKLADLQKENFLLSEQQKESQERVIDLTDEVDLLEGIQEELKSEIIELKAEIERATRKNEKLVERTEKIDHYEQLNLTLENAKQELEQELAKEKTLAASLKQRVDILEQAKKDLSKKIDDSMSNLKEKMTSVSTEKNDIEIPVTWEELVQFNNQRIIDLKQQLRETDSSDRSKIKELNDQISKIREGMKSGPDSSVSISSIDDEASQGLPLEPVKGNQEFIQMPGEEPIKEKTGVNLNRIVVSNKKSTEEPEVKTSEIVQNVEGRVLTVDREMNFVITDLGTEDNISEGQMFSVYRGDDHLGEIKITRVRPNMSAADVIAPLRARSLRRDDKVRTKQ